MKKKTTYTDEQLGELEIIADFLPPPAELAFREDAIQAHDPAPPEQPMADR